MFCNFIANVSNRTEVEDIDYNVSYASPNFDIVPEGSKYYILNITIVPDETLEENELFRIYVEQPVRPDDTMVIQTDVIIMNDDGESLVELYICSTKEIHTYVYTSGEVRGN